MQKDLDVVIYGATGFTGRLCAKYFSSLDSKIKWGIAGRDGEKLEKITNKNPRDIPILVAECDDKQALDEITKRTKVILSTAGPFHRYGSLLVQSCVDNSTHYVDITGETFWVKQLIDKHHDEAARKGIRIIPGCGYDSIPSDIGCFFGATAIKKPLKQIQSFHSWKGEASGGTLETVFSIGEGSSKTNLMDPFLLNPEASRSRKRKSLSSDRISVEKIEELDAWSGAFIMSPVNSRVVRRSEGLLEERQISYGPDFVYKENGYFQTPIKAYQSLIFMGVLGLILLTPLKKIVRPFLRKPGEGPSEHVQENGWFNCKFLADTVDGERYLFGLSGKGDPGYRVTSKLVCEAAVSLVENFEDLPGGPGYGGVLTSASGLGRVLVNRLKKIGITFDDPRKL